MPDLRSVFCAGKFCFEYSYMLLVIIPVIIALYFFVNRSFIKFFNRSEHGKKGVNMFFQISRI